MHTPVRVRARLRVLTSLAALTTVPLTLTLLPDTAASAAQQQPAAVRVVQRAATSADGNAIDTRSPAAVRQAYVDRWAPATSTKMTLSGGSTGSCTTFSTGATQQQRTLDSLNFARGLVGANKVRFTATYNNRAAASALIMAANGNLSHDPPSSWKCWTQGGHDAAGRSNILINSSTPTAARVAELYLDEPGSTNTAVGHRRWLLRPEATTMGSGNAQGDWFGNSIYVFTFDDDQDSAPAKPYYAWPSAGYFPSQLEPAGRWSLSSSSGASFAHAKVTMTGPDGKAVAITQHAVANGYGDNTLAWNLNTVPATVSTSAASTYRVTVSGITGGPSTSYTYYVRLFDPTAKVTGTESSQPADQALVAPVRTRTSMSVSRRTTKRHGRVRVVLRTAAANGTQPSGRIVLFLGKSRLRTLAVSAGNRSTRVVVLRFGSKGRKTLRAVFVPSGSYAGSRSAAVAIRVR